jgi:hypothetical protein
VGPSLIHTPGSLNSQVKPSSLFLPVDKRTGFFHHPLIIFLSIVFFFKTTTFCFSLVHFISSNILIICYCMQLLRTSISSGVCRAERIFYAFSAVLYLAPLLCTNGIDYGFDMGIRLIRIP